MKKVVFIVMLSLLWLQGFSFHIVGGEMIYNDLGNGKYQIILKIYRDCAATNASAFDGTDNAGPQAYLTVYDAANIVEGVYNIGFPIISTVPSSFTNPCVYAPNSICIEEGVYTYTLSLPPKTGGYTVVYQRCCRNSIIQNLLNADSQGATYFAEIPGPEDAPTNNSPRFSKFPPIYICGNVPLSFDHVAVDPDGDKLIYSLCSPYTGLEGCCSVLNFAPGVVGPNCVSPPSSCPTEAPPPPYANVLFTAPYSGTYPIDSNPAFSINPVTGELAGTPTQIGQYVVGVCVQEFRNNKLLNTHFRDFQFTVIGCTVTVLSAVADQEQQCQGKTITFKNQSTNNSATPVYHWDFGVGSLISDTSNIFSPTYNYPDTGIYIISLVTNPGKPCTDTLKKPVYVYPPLDINFASPNRQCFTNNSFSFAVRGEYAAQAAFDWDFTPAAFPPAGSDNVVSGIHFNQSGLHFVKLKAQQFACVDSFIDSVRVLKKPIAKINNLQSGLCDPALIGFSNGSTSELPIKYKWLFSNGKNSSDFEPTQIFSPAGLYSATLIVETTEVCKDTAMHRLIDILINPKPIAGFTFTPREASIFEPDIRIKSFASQDAISSVFDFGDGQTTTLLQDLHTYSDYGNYRIKQVVTNQFGCIDTLSDIVKILPEFRFWIPNAFTPDNNSRNDFFMPATIGISLYRFEIFNRWGQKIFSTNKTEEGWNGSYRGAECPQGVYVWKISFRNLATEESETHHGNVTLIRNP